MPAEKLPLQSPVLAEYVPDEKTRETVPAVIEYVPQAEDAAVTPEMIAELHEGDMRRLRIVCKEIETCDDDTWDRWVDSMASDIVEQLVPTLDSKQPQYAVDILGGILELTTLQCRRVYGAEASADVLMDRVASRMLSVLRRLDPATIAAMRQLAEYERTAFDSTQAIIGEVCDAVIARNSDDGYLRVIWQRDKASCEGYGTLRAKYEAVQRGELACDNLPLTDVLLDELIKTYTAARKGEQGKNDTQVAIRQLVEELGLHGALVRNIAEATKRRFDGGKYAYNSYGACGWVDNLMARVGQIGITDIERLYEECGIVNFADIPLSQLRRMVKFIDKDPELMEHLQQHEVCALVKDATNDYNHAFTGAYKMFETEEEATLVFEIAGEDGWEPDSLTRTQIARVGESLKERNIQLSALVIAGHGDRGGTQMGSAAIGGKGGMTLAESGLLDIMMNNMKPDRDGNCSIVYDSCSQDAPLDGGEDDTVLTRTAADLQAWRSLRTSVDKGTLTYMIYGVKVPYVAYKSSDNGELYAKHVPREEAQNGDSSEDGIRESVEVPIERVIVTKHDNIYRDLYKGVPEAGKDTTASDAEALSGRVLLPMFKRG